ncbi:MAG: glycosyltransferase family 2 protein [Spirochaetes bacterium]|jgi:glycosyltransferase involved in cell wall biosynthesis|nr:glycosyltransferase family 2 protein [Spirochaetota bacterium]
MALAENKKKVQKKTVKKTIRTKKAAVQVSVILPVYNEEENIALQYEKVSSSMKKIALPYEIIFVDDGSQDSSAKILSAIALADKSVKLIVFRRNFGQTAAMRAGIDHAIGEIIVFMDSDLQNESDDIQLLLDKIEEGYDVAAGWRKKRHDKFFSRRVPSFFANKIIAWVTGVKLHDLGCSLKAFRADVLKKVKLYGEMHRFIPVHASWIGASIIEVPVRHHARKFGKSKYGMIRTFKVLLDLITIKFLGSFSTKPIYLYGGLGIVIMFFAGISAILVVVMKILYRVNMTGNPFFLLFFLFVILSATLALMGIQTEILIRIYHESTHRSPYYVKEVVNDSVKKV